MRKSLLVLIISLFFTSVVLAQDDIDPNTLTLVDIYHADGLVEANMTVSPDASMLVFLAREALCIDELPDKNQTCYPVPEELQVSRPVLYWSPDSRYIALHEDFFRRFVDSDIWVFDVQAQQFQNLTDDNTTDNILSGDDTAPIDYLPVWHPVTGDLYFFRSYRTDETEDVAYTLALFRSARENGELTEPVQHRNLTAFQQEPLAFYDLNPMSLSGAAVMSPDGEQMALLYRPRERELAAVWLMDMDTGQMDPLVPYMDLTSRGIPEYKRAEAYILESLAWAGEGLIVSTYDYLYYSEGVTWMAYYVSLSGEVSPLFDFTHIADSEAFIAEQPEDGFAARYDVPVHSVVSPDGSTFIYFNNDRVNRTMGLSALPVPPDGSEPIRLVELEDYVVTPFTRASVGFDGETLRVVVFSHTFTFETGE